MALHWALASKNDVYKWKQMDRVLKVYLLLTHVNTILFIAQNCVNAAASQQF